MDKALEVKKITTFLQNILGSYFPLVTTLIFGSTSIKLYNIQVMHLNIKKIIT